MASYVPNASDPTEPTEARFVESAAAEFRTLKARGNRAIHFPDSDPESAVGDIPPAAERLGLYLAFDPVTGEPMAAASLPPSTPVSPFGASLVAALSDDAARTLLETLSTAEIMALLQAIPGRNKIMNGKADIAQRGATFAAIANAAYSLDRWIWSLVGAGVVTASQQADGPASAPEFPNSLRVAITTADAAIAAGDLAFIGQRIEGYNIRDLIGRSFTLSFWVRSSEVGAHSVALRNTGNDRSFIAPYTVNVANTWERKTITVTGGLPTAGTWDYTTGTGLKVDWVLAAGTTFHAVAASAWQTGNFLAVAGQVNCLDTIGNIFAITGVQLEVGTVATAFDHMLHSEELHMLERYFESSLGASVLTSIPRANDGIGSVSLYFRTRKRAVPAVGVTGGTTASISVDGFTWNTAPGVNGVVATNFTATAELAV